MGEWCGLWHYSLGVDFGHISNEPLESLVRPPEPQVQEPSKISGTQVGIILGLLCVGVVTGVAIIYGRPAAYAVVDSIVRG